LTLGLLTKTNRKALASSSTAIFSKMTNPVRNIARLIIALCLLVKPAAAQNGVTATESWNYTALANLIFNPDVTGVKINGVEFTGNPQQAGTYATTGNFFNGLPGSGVVMSSGRVVDVQQGGGQSTNFGLSGDSDLTKVLRGSGLSGNAASTYDAAVLVVDVSVPKAVNIDIAFVFGSREYNYPLSMQHADVFGLFQGGTNIALVGDDPVSVKTINCKTNKNCNQFIGSSGWEGTSLTGYTQVQVATLELRAGTNQKVKIAVADGGPTEFGGIGDAAVFLSFQSFRPTPGSTVTATESTANTDLKALANLIFRPDVTGVTINSAVFTGDVRQLGNYTATGTVFNGLPRSGVVMSSGKVVEVKEGGYPFTEFGGSGDDDLTNELKRIGLTGDGAATVDAAVLVVDVTVSKPVDIEIAYVFGSAEYNYFQFADVFGADVFGLFHGGTNIALIRNDPVSVKTVNCGTTTGIPARYCDQLIDNSGRVSTSLSGYTKTQIATLKLPVGQNQKVKIAVADAFAYFGDPFPDFVDTAVFVSFRSFQLAPTQSP
jgi:hypothetical protein